ncbi:hypothetical protein ACWGR4_38790 [Embleya sp. NPDC055664]
MKDRWDPRHATTRAVSAWRSTSSDTRVPLTARAQEARSVRPTLRTTDEAPSEKADRTVIADMDIRAQGRCRGEADSPSGYAEFRRTVNARDELTTQGAGRRCAGRR